MKQLITYLLVAAFAIVSGQASADGNAGYGKQKVVYHVNYDNPKKQRGALRNIQNHINAVGAANLDLRVVMHGNGLSLLMRANEDDGVQSSVANLKNQGIGFKVCANTLRGRKINYEDDLYDVNKGDIVPSGVAELAHLQGQGYSYVKP
jgi:uncharacterized protein